jgi:hypothetical protein
LEPLLAVKPPQTLMIDVHSFAVQQQVKPTIAEAATKGRELPESTAKGAVIRPAAAKAN